MKPEITVFTPTYNRAYILNKLYESLLIQNTDNFEWLIVDDGSMDNTKNLIKQWISDNKIPIRYIFQENQGKHIAINTGTKNAEGKYFLVVDSDDYLKRDALKICGHLAEKIDEKRDFAGFTIIHFSEEYSADESKYGKKEWVYGQKKYEWEFPGEAIFCYKTEVLKEFPFPQFSGEKFCPESLIHRRIRRKKYHILFTDYYLMSGDYLEDGLSSRYMQMMMNSPRAAMLSYKEKIWDTKNNAEKKEYARIYWDIALKSKHIPWKEKISSLPLYWTLRIFLNKFFHKFMKNHILKT